MENERNKKILDKRPPKDEEPGKNSINSKEIKQEFKNLTLEQKFQLLIHYSRSEMSSSLRPRKLKSLG